MEIVRLRGFNNIRRECNVARKREESTEQLFKEIEIGRDRHEKLENKCRMLESRLSSLLSKRASRSPITMLPAVARFLHLPKREDDDDFGSSQMWIPDEELGFRLCTILDDALTEVLVGFRDAQGFFEKKRVLRVDCEIPSRNIGGSDLCTLTEPNAATVLESLTRRYTNQVIHTYCGLFCVVLNPWKNIPVYSQDVMDCYSTPVGELPPHVYAVAQSACDGMKSGAKNQSILITGESGAGKTVNTKKILDYILHSSSMYLSTDSRMIGEHIVTAGVLLEAFGNAKTTHNNNSSRFGKFIRIEFDEDGVLQSALIECYLLEKSRVVQQNEGERCFHIFYELLSSELSSVAKRCGLTKKANEYKFLSGGHAEFDKDIDDDQCARDVDKAMDDIGIISSEKESVYRLVALCILIGEIRFGERSGLDMSYVEGKEESEAVATLLGVRSSRLIDALTQPTLKVGDKLIRKNQSLAKTLQTTTAMTKTIYERLFKWLLGKCNDAICKSMDVECSIMRRFIGVLDIAGFEILKVNSFEQLCINFTNEKLQQFFNHFMFVKEQAEYMDEGIQWTQIDYANDLQPTIDAIEKPLGLLALLEEECVVPKGSDLSLLEKLCTNLKSSKKFSKAKQSQRCQQVRHFTIAHYAGSVDYNIESWIEKNRDSIETSILELLSESTDPLMKELFPPASTDITKSRRGTLTQATITFVYKNQLQSLLETLNQSAAHFIRCVVPNHDRVAGNIDGPLVLNQLRCNGVLEGIRICRQGYPSRVAFDEFLTRYRILSSQSFQDYGREAVRALCESINMDVQRYYVGKTKLFCKVGVISELENERKERITTLITRFQAQIRSYNAMLAYNSRLEQYNAIEVIQTNVRNFASLCNWPWYRILCLTRPLIPINRDKERIVELEAKIAEMHTATERLTKENEDLQVECDELLEKCEEIELSSEQTKETHLKQMAEKESEIKRIRAEVRENDGVFELLEKKYNEQHLKVIKMNDILRDFERKLAQAELERDELNKELLKTKTTLEKEKEHRMHLEKELAEVVVAREQIENRFDRLNAEHSDLVMRLAKAENEVEEEKQHVKRLHETISQLQRNISELNDKGSKVDSAVSEEKNLRKKIEREKDRIADELNYEKEQNEKLNQKIEALKEEARRKDHEIKRLEKKIEDREAVMADCVKELKEQQKTRISELEKKIDELKRNNSKLESENKTHKMRLETTLERNERESSVDSDYGRSSSGRLSNIGRQYSLTSVSSFSSVRTLNRRRDTEPEPLSTSLYTPRRRGSVTDVMSSSYTLQRTPSSSQLMDKEREVSNLERKLGQLNTDHQLLKRELEAYRSNLSAVEQEKDSVSRQLRTSQAESEATSRQLQNSEKDVDQLKLRMKNAQSDADSWKKKYEELAIESKNEIMAHRRRANERIEAYENENSKKPNRSQLLEQAKEELQNELVRTQAELDRATVTIMQLQSNVNSQEALGGSMDHQYRTLCTEMQEIRDENCALKAKIRRQHKQIELLTQHEETNDAVSFFETKADNWQSNNNYD